MKESIGIDMLRSIFAMLDRVVYGLITIFYNTITDIASAQIISGEQINTIASRIYALLGIFMLFKVSFSLITYIISPDTIVEKSKGGGALIRNILITFVLLITVPFGFDLLYELQGAILSDNIIPNLVFGETGQNTAYEIKMAEDCSVNAVASNAGDYIGLMAFRPFFTIDEKANKSDWEDIKSIYCAGNSTGNAGNASVRNLLKNSEVYNAPHGFSTSHYYVVDYSYIISTAIGVVVALLFLTFCFDTGIRMLVLQFLEVLAPIPIISFIDPNSSKNGMWSKYLKRVLSTWGSLFIRLSVVFFAIFVISLLNESELHFLSGYQFNGSMLWLKLLIILSALLSYKEITSIIEEITGMKLGKMELNPLKRIRDNALGGKAISGAVGAGLGLAASGLGQGLLNAGAFFRDKHNLKKNIDKEDDAGKRKALEEKMATMTGGRFLATTAGGLAGGARRGLVSGGKSGSKGSANVLKNIVSDVKEGNRARNNRTAIRDYNRIAPEGQKYTWGDRNVTERFDKMAGVKNEEGGYGYYQKQITKLDREISDNDSKESGIRNQLAGMIMNAGHDQMLLERIHKTMVDIKDTGERDRSLNALQSEFGLADPLFKLAQEFYEENTRMAMNSIDTINAHTKELKKEKKQYSEMVNARQSAEKK